MAEALAAYLLGWGFNMLTFQFTAYKGYRISTERGIESLAQACNEAREHQALGWVVDYICDSDGRVLLAVEPDAMRIASKGLNRH